MRMLKFYFNVKAGLRSPSRTLRNLSNILCWILNVCGAIAAGVMLLLFGSRALYNKTLTIAIFQACVAIIFSVLTLLAVKLLSWMCAFSLECKAIHLEAYEKILKMDFDKAEKIEVS